MTVMLILVLPNYPAFYFHCHVCPVQQLFAIQHSYNSYNWSVTSLPVNQRPRQQPDWTWTMAQDDDQMKGASADYWEHRTTTCQTSALSEHQHQCQSLNRTRNLSSHTTCSPTPSAAANGCSSHVTVTVFVIV